MKGHLFFFLLSVLCAMPRNDGDKEDRFIHANDKGGIDHA